MTVPAAAQMAKWLVALTYEGVIATRCTLDAMCAFSIAPAVRKYTIVPAATAAEAIERAKWLLAMVVLGRMDAGDKWVAVDAYPSVLSPGGPVQRAAEELMAGRWQVPDDATVDVALQMAVLGFLGNTNQEDGV